MAARRVVVVGGGFAGFEVVRSLVHALPANASVEVVLVNPTDYFLYLPLLPEVAAGVLDRRRVPARPRTQGAARAGPAAVPSG
jgi:NADH dehydrogenase